MKVGIKGIGSYGPGFESWAELRSILTQQRRCPDASTGSPKPDMIPARERRRSPLAVRLAVKVASEACSQAGINPAIPACVFASGMSDTDVTDYMCATLNSREKLLSPTRFHNSVHNAAAGYWSISTGCIEPANSVCAFDLTAAVALLEASIQCCIENRPVLLVVFDIATSGPLRDIVQIDNAFAAAVLIDGELAGATLDIQTMNTTESWPDLNTESLESLYRSNPAAGILALFETLANDSPAPLTMPVGPQCALKVEFTS